MRTVDIIDDICHHADAIKDLATACRTVGNVAATEVEQRMKEHSDWIIRLTWELEHGHPDT